ncbi:hypothetical protein HXX76_011805 [Chlamydomonas incerta]|uniref:Uncharacterized protein n=1 Tax=Chlamydomonas incerta TaxID=51695 RepID=A0A835VUA9_CHLIN|nr:hypothetical protein HXX76_011805 [Chlamydomonas incerta]|eukprot:KAG2428125.1 hypothetical protein HXX76_011805 [Chlamydomonas incerta]
MGGWRATFQDTSNGHTTAVTAPFVVLAAGHELILPLDADLSLGHHPGAQKQQGGSGAHSGCVTSAPQPSPQPSKPARMLAAAAAAAAHVAAASSVRVIGAGTALLSSARRRALAASLQPHYATPQPGPLGKALRAPAKRRFWALVKDKLSLGRRGGGSSSGSSGSTGEHLVLWAPSLHDPRFMPFLSAPLRQALLGGVSTAEGDGDLALYRGMVHPDVPGLAFVGLEAHAGSSLLLLELQAQWLAAHLAGRLALPPAAAMRADVAAQRVWRSGALAHPLMSAGGSLARRHEQCYLQQLRQDLRGAGLAAAAQASMGTQWGLGQAEARAFRPLPEPRPVLPLRSDGMDMPDLTSPRAGFGGGSNRSAISAAQEGAMLMTGSQQQASRSQRIGARLPAHDSTSPGVEGPFTVHAQVPAEAGPRPADRPPPSSMSPAVPQFFIARYRTASSRGMIAASAPTSPRRRDPAPGAAARPAASRPASSRFRHVDDAVSEAEVAEEAAGRAAEHAVHATPDSQSHSAIGAGWLANAATRNTLSGPLHGVQPVCSASRLVICTPLSDGESDADASVRGGARHNPGAGQASAACDARAKADEDVESRAVRLHRLSGDQAYLLAASTEADVSSGPFEASAAGPAAPLAVLQEISVEADMEGVQGVRLACSSPPSAISDAEAFDLMGWDGREQRGHDFGGGDVAQLQSRLQQLGHIRQQGQALDELDVTVGPVGPIGAAVLGVDVFGTAQSSPLPVSSSRQPQLEFVLAPPSQQPQLLQRTRGGSHGSSGSGSVVLQLPSVRGGVVADLLAAGDAARRTAAVDGSSDFEEHGLEEADDIFGLTHLLPPSQRTSPTGRISAGLADQHAISLPLPQWVPHVPSHSSRSHECSHSSGCAIPLATAQQQSRPFPMQLPPADLPLQQPVPVNNITDDFELLDPEAESANAALEDRSSPVGSSARVTPGTSPFRSAYASARRLSLAPRCPATIVGLADSLISTADGHGFHGAGAGPPSAGWSGAPGRPSMNAALLLSSVHSSSFGRGGGSPGGVGAAASGVGIASRMLGTLKKMGSLVRPPAASPQPTVMPPRRSATGLGKGGHGSIGGVLPPALSHLAAMHVLAPGSVRDGCRGQHAPSRGDARDGATSDAFSLVSQNQSQRSSGGSGHAAASPGGSAGSPVASVPASRRALASGASIMLRHNPAHSHLQQALQSAPRMSSPSLQDMHDDLLEAARWSAAQRQERDMRRQLTQRAQGRERLSMVGMSAVGSDVGAASSQAPQQQQQQDKGAVPSSQRPQLSEPLPSPVHSPLQSPRPSRAPSPLLQAHAQPHAAPSLPLNWFARHSIKVKTVADAPGPPASGPPPAAGGSSSRAFRRSCTSPRSPLSPAGREHSRMRNMALAEGSGPSSPLRSGSAHALAALAGSTNALQAVVSGEVPLGMVRAAGGRFARGASVSGPGGLGPRALAAAAGGAAEVVGAEAGVEPEAGPTDGHCQTWLNAAAAGISEAGERAHSTHGSISSCGVTGALLGDVGDAMEDGVRRGGPAWEVIQASRARQEQMVNQVSAWLREALAKKAAAQATNVR